MHKAMCCFADACKLKRAKSSPVKHKLTDDAMTSLPSKHDGCNVAVGQQT